MERWATFDCYGTLIDWNGGLRLELARVFGDDAADAKLDEYHQVEPGLQESGQRSYREVMTEAMRLLGAPAGQEYGLAESLPAWRPFSEVPHTLEELRRRGWKLALLSNTDDDLIAASQVQLGMVLDKAVVAQEMGSFKTAHTHLDQLLSRPREPRKGNWLLEDPYLASKD
jgi:2-haloacid dehalogenase